MTRPLTAQIKPSTKHALMEQLALAADEISGLRHKLSSATGQIVHLRDELEYRKASHAGALVYASRHIAYLEQRPLRQIARERLLMWWRK